MLMALCWSQLKVAMFAVPKDSLLNDIQGLFVSDDTFLHLIRWYHNPRHLVAYLMHLCINIFNQSSWS